MRGEPITVSVSGPPCSGKTTLVEAVMRRLEPRIVSLPDLPRRALEDLASQAVRLEWKPEEFQHYVGFSQVLAEAALPSVSFRLLDKSLVDAVAYWDVLVGGRRPGWSRALTKKTYDAIIVCDYRDVEAPPKGIAQTHYHLRSRLAAAIEEVAVESCENVMVLSGSRTTRVAKAVKLLERLGSQTR